MPGLEGVDQ